MGETPFEMVGVRDQAAREVGMTLAKTGWAGLGFDERHARGAVIL